MRVQLPNEMADCTAAACDVNVVAGSSHMTQLLLLTYSVIPLLQRID